jgi:WD40 repeat protein
MINKIATDAQNRYLVTASDDKTLRVWELSTGRLLKTLRPPIGEGHEGKLFAVAISSDGKIIATGGWTGYEWEGSGVIYIFDRESGSLIKRITGLENAILHLAFSKDGRYLVAGLGVNWGIRIYRISDYKEVMRATDYEDGVYGADFDKDGRLVTTSYDGYIRLYDSDFRLHSKVKAPHGKNPFGVSFSPDGSKIAVGYFDSTWVDVFSGSDLSYLFSPDIRDVDNGNLGSVAWSLDGRFLYAGGMYWSGALNYYPIRKWDDEGRGRYVDLPAANSTIMDILPLKDGGIAFGSAEPSFGVFDRDDKRPLYKGPPIADYGGNPEGFLLSYDGSVVKFGYEVFRESPAVFSFSERRIETDEELFHSILGSNKLYPPKIQGEKIKVTDWEDTYTPKLNGKPLQLEPYEPPSALAISPDEERFLLGTGWNLYLFDRYGNKIWGVPTPSVAQAVNISGDGRVAVAAFGDGTIRWYRIKDGAELLAFFPHNDKKRWVLWTPSGYYDASPGGDELIGWHINNGKEEAADFFPASRFRSRYYRPDIITKVLETLDEEEAIRLSSEESGRKTDEKKIAEILPPVVRIIHPYDGYEATTDELTVKYTIYFPSGEPVTGIKVLIDGRPAAQERGIMLKSKDDISELKVLIPKRDCEISILAENRYSVSEPATVRLKWKGEAKEEFIIKPKLYILAIGVSKYMDKELQLQFAAKDAQDFVKVMEKQKGLLYRDIVVKLLTDEKATKDEILDGLDWLRKETTSKDVAMVFLAGHGVNDQAGIYYFLPVNVDIDRLMRTGVAFSDIKNAVQSIAGKVLLFVDACHSGNVMGGRRALLDINAVVNELSSAESGVVVFASSSGRQYSFEDPKWNNGAFTKALVEGLSGKADYTGKGKITINMLDLYISERVKELTKGKQTPTTAKPNTVPDFPIAVLR